MRHLPIPDQERYLRLVVNGFYNYYAVPTTGCAACGGEASDTG
jgi:hypothetical protein